MYIVKVIIPESRIVKGNVLGNKMKSPLNCHFSNEDRDNYPNFLAEWQCVNLFVSLADVL